MLIRVTHRHHETLIFDPLPKIVDLILFSLPQLDLIDPIDILAILQCLVQLRFALRLIIQHFFIYHTLRWRKSGHHL